MLNINTLEVLKNRLNANNKIPYKNLETEMNAVLYIYYCIDREKTKEATQVVENIFNEVEKRAQVRGRLLCKMEEGSTWLEVYGPVKNIDSLLNIVEDAAFKNGMKQYLQKGTCRHIERFVPISELP